MASATPRPLLADAEPELVPGRWVDFDGDSQAIMGVNFGYHQQIVHPTHWKNNLPVKVKYFTGEKISPVFVAVDQGTKLVHQAKFEELVQLWCPNYQNNPPLEKTFDQVWKQKEDKLKILCSCIDKPYPFVPEWRFNRELMNQKFPHGELRDYVFENLVQTTDNAFTGGMYNSRAKSFLIALGAYLLDGCPGFYQDQCISLTGMSELKGKVRYLSLEGFENSQSFPQNEFCLARPSRPSSCASSSQGSPSSGGSSFVGGAKYNPDRVYRIIPDCILTMVNYKYLTCVFECTRMISAELPLNQNFRQLLSLMHYQSSMFGCLLTPDGYCFQLVVKENPENANMGKLKYYTTPQETFRFEEQLNPDIFMKLAKSLLKLIYIKAQHLNQLK